MFRYLLLRQLHTGETKLERAQKKVAVTKEERSKVISVIQEMASFYEEKSLAEKFRLLV